LKIPAGKNTFFSKCRYPAIFCSWKKLRFFAAKNSWIYRHFEKTPVFFPPPKSTVFEKKQAFSQKPGKCAIFRTYQVPLHTGENAYFR